MTLRQINVGRAQSLFVKIESTAGQYNYPTSSDAVKLADDASFKQEADFIEDPERVPGYSKVDRVFAGWNPGEFVVPVYLKPISAGTEPRCGPLFEALLGKKTVNAGSNVQYTPHTLGETLPTLTFAFRIASLVYWIAGAIVDQCTIGVNPKELMKAEFSGKFYKMAWAGKTTLSQNIDGTTTPVTDIPVTDPRQFTVDAMVKIGTDDNSGQGFKVTSVDLTNNKIVVSPGVQTAQSSGATVEGFLPTETDAGELIAWRLGLVSETPSGGSATNIKVTGGQVEIVNNVDIFWEKADEDYPTAWKRGTREIRCQLTMYMGDSDIAYLRDVFDNREYQVVLPGGNQSGKIFKVTIPKALPKHPEHSWGIEEITLTRAFDVIAQNIDDEITISFE